MEWDVPRTANGVLVLVDLGSDHGVAAETALRGTGLNGDLLRSADAEVTPRQEAMVIANLLEALPHIEGLGLQAGLRYHLTTYGIWGFALISSPTLRSAIEVGLRFLDLTFAFSRIQARLVDDEFQFVLDTPGVPTNLQRFAIERDGANIQLLQREVFAAAIPIRRAAFAFPPPVEVAPYLETFGVVPQFDADESIIAFDPTMLDAPLPQANANTAAFAQAQCRELLERRQARAGLSGQVRDLILARPAGPPDAEEVARALRLSSRTLRERLAAEGTSYRALLDEVRERLAEEMLIVNGLTVAQTAERLGYVELSSFSQAFRRWKGMGPRDYRAQKMAVGR